MSKKICIVLMTAMFLLSTMAVLSVTAQSSGAYVSHGPIVIATDAGLTPANGVTGGSGSESDPYEIEGLEIDAASSSGISISSTTKYIRIAYCKIKGATGANAGILLSDVKNIDIDYVVFENNAIGIKIATGDNIDIDYSTFTNDPIGIQANDVKNMDIDYNSFSGSTTSVNLNGGTHASNSNNNVDYNTFAGGDVGVNANKAENLNVDYNTFVNVKKGITWNDVKSSAFDYNGFTGGTSHAELTSAVSSSGDYNLFKDATSYAIVLTGTTSCSFNYNNFINNNGNGKQAKTSGVSNLTEDIDGNYWDDWTSPDADQDGIVDVPYALDGGELEDNEPVADQIPGVGVTITPPLVAITAQPKTGTVPLTVVFMAGVTGGIPPYTLAWDFGDSGTGAGTIVSHEYATAGTFKAKVKVTDYVTQEVTSSEVTITVSEPPPLTASISTDKTSGDYPLKVTFTATATGGYTPYTYSWDFGDTKTGTGAQADHTYETDGTFTAKLTVTDNNGGTKTAEVSITVTSPIPPLEVTASASKITGRAPLKVDLTSTVKGGQGPYTYKWSHQGGDIGTAGNLTHKFTKAGTFIITLEVTDSLGTKETATTSVVVLPKKITDTPGFEAGLLVIALVLVFIALRRRK